MSRTRCCFCLTLAFSVVGLHADPVNAQPPGGARPDFAAIQEASKKDRQLMLDQLKIESPRISTGYISSSGAGGAKLHRRDFGEIIENVCATSEYHWMAGNYLKYAGPLNWSDLPVDAHQLVALCAPRPVFLSAGATKGDGWVDAKGTFLAGVGASPVYALLGKKGLKPTEFPEIETPLVDGDLAFRQHAGGHTDGPNWPTFLDFAARYWEPK